MYIILSKIKYVNIFIVIHVSDFWQGNEIKAKKRDLDPNIRQITTEMFNASST